MSIEVDNVTELDSITIHFRDGKAFLDVAHKTTIVDIKSKELLAENRHREAIKWDDADRVTTVLGKDLKDTIAAVIATQVKK